MTRKEVKAAGLDFYLTGKPCKHGHYSPRYTTTCACVECVKIQTTKWKAENPEKHAECVREWHQNNREIHAARVRRWQAANKDKIRKDSRAWVAANRERVLAKAARYRKAHPERGVERAMRRQMDKLKRTPPWLSDDQFWMIREAYRLAKQRTHLFGFRWQVDHVVPLRGKSVSGLHVPWNLQVIPAIVNQRKGNRVRAEQPVAPLLHWSND